MNWNKRLPVNYMPDRGAARSMTVNQSNGYTQLYRLYGYPPPRPPSGRPR